MLTQDATASDLFAAFQMNLYYEEYENKNHLLTNSCWLKIHKAQPFARTEVLLAVLHATTEKCLRTGKQVKSLGDRSSAVEDRNLKGRTF